MLFLALAAAAQAAPAADPVEARMVAIYDEVCLKAFPIDAAVDAAMAAKGAFALTPEQVKVTLVDDPGRGWALRDGDEDFLVFLELPPYHACSVRRFTPNGFADLSAYRAVADRYEAAHAGFRTAQPMETDVRDIHVHLVGEQRILPGGGAESLMAIDQHAADPARRAADPRVNVRFVHQIKAE